MSRGEDLEEDPRSIPSGRPRTFLFVRLSRCLRGLLRDARVPWTAKAELALLGLYLACPVDVIPDFIPGLGHLDDVLIVVWVLRRFIHRVGWDVLREHWGADTQALSQIIEQGKKEPGKVPPGEEFDGV